jgi:hypothetical protein
MIASGTNAGARVAAAAPDASRGRPHHADENAAADSANVAM